MQDQRISEAIEREQSRLSNFIWKRVANQGNADDVLQDIFYELIEAYRLMTPIEQVTAWLFKVAAIASQICSVLRWEDLLPSQDGGPDAEYASSAVFSSLVD